MPRDISIYYILVFICIGFFIINNLSFLGITGGFVGNFSVNIAGQNQVPENPETTSTSSASSGGTVTIPNFEVTPDISQIELIQGGVETEVFEIKNTGEKELEIKISSEGISNFLTLDSNKILVEPGKIASIKIGFFSVKETEPGVYIGKIKFTGQGVEKEVKIIVKVDKRFPLFDISTRILPEYKIVHIGDKINALIELKNIGLHGELIDVGVSYKIMDFNRQVLYKSSKEDVAISTQASFNREFTILSNMLPGKYILISDVKYQNTTADSYDTFDVIGKKTSNSITKQINLVLLVVIIILIIQIIYLTRKRKR